MRRASEWRCAFVEDGLHCRKKERWEVAAKVDDLRMRARTWRFYGMGNRVCFKQSLNIIIVIITIIVTNS